MKENVLADIESLLDNIFDGESGVEKSSTDNFSRDVLEKLVEYVRNCNWSDNETIKFVARNFTVSQNYFPELWHTLYPDKPEKAESTFRTSYQSINSYLRNVLPKDLMSIFVTCNKAGLESLSRLIDSLYMNGRRIEDQLGSQLCYALSSLRLPSRKYDVKDCLNELQALRTLSVANSMDILKSCDESKLAYTYYVLTRPSVIKGKVNDVRLSFIRQLLSMDSGIHVEEVKSHVVDSSYILLGVVKSICDTMESGANVQKVMELIRTALEDYGECGCNVLLDGLKTSYNLLSTGNDVVSVSNVLKKSMLSNIGGISDNSINEKSVTTEVHEIPVFDLSIRLKDNKSVYKLLDEIRDYCDEHGLDYPESGLVMTTGAFDVIKQYVSDVDIPDSTMLNTDVINYLHLHCTRQGIRRGLTKFPKEDVAYVVREMNRNNKEYMDAVRNGINIEMINRIGDIEMCEEAKHTIESSIEDIEPSSTADESVIRIVKDYTVAGMQSRIKGVSPNELAKVYDDILSNNSDTVDKIRSSY